MTHSIPASKTNLNSITNPKPDLLLNKWKTKLDSLLNRWQNQSCRLRWWGEGKLGPVTGSEPLRVELPLGRLVPSRFSCSFVSRTQLDWRVTFLVRSVETQGKILIQNSNISKWSLKCRLYWIVLRCHSSACRKSQSILFQWSNDGRKLSLGESHKNEST